MKKNDNQLALIKKLWNFLSQDRKNSFYGLIVMAFISSISELFVIVTVVPFLMIFFNFSSSNQLNFITSLFNFGISTSDKFSTISTLLFSFAVLISGLIRVSMLRFSLKYAFSLGAEFSSMIFLFALKANYSLNKRIKTGDLINAANDKVNIAIHNIFLPLINLLSSIITIFIVLFFLLIVKPIPTISSITVILCLFIFYNFFTHVKLDQNSEIISRKMNESLGSFQQGLATVKDITLSNQFNFFVDKYYSLTSDVRSAQYKNAFIKFSPRYIFETFILVCIILILSNFSSNQSELALYMPIIGMFCLTIYRLLPYFNQVYLSYSSIKGDLSILKDLFKYLDFIKDIKVDKNPNSKILKLKKSIILRGVSYKFNSKSILKDINLTIKKGEHLGIIGKSGSGKSTLADIIMSLLVPTSGDLVVDGVIINKENHAQWKKNVSHVSQDFFLIDGSVEDNIVLGSQPGKIKIKELEKALFFSQLKFFTDSLPEKNKTQVGEFGSNLSGGERQRIAIARALYKNTDILVLDESTSSLDTQTEKLFVASLLKLKGEKTIISISHNISSLIYCDFIIEIEKGLVIKSGRPSDFQKKDNFSV
jgi:ABC-type multidrug transport system fused ATPase/permease subunit